MLPYGCKVQAARMLLPNVDVYSDLNSGSVNVGDQFILTRIAGDCTACVLAMDNMKLTNIHINFKNVQNLMSVSGRINAFFSKTIYSKDNVQAWIDKLKNFNVVGLNVQKSNRDPEKDWWQISGILKCPNPVVNDYTQLEALPANWSTHNSQDVTKYNELATLYKRPKLKETNYAAL